LPELVAHLTSRREALQRLLLDGNGSLQPTILFFVGDDQVAPDDDLNLKEGDVVTLMAPIAGGS
jgi:molybdopterin converting factor small subunit